MLWIIAVETVKAEVQVVTVAEEVRHNAPPVSIHATVPIHTIVLAVLGY